MSLTIILEPEKGAGIANVRCVTWHDEEEVAVIIHQAEEVLAASPAYDHFLDAIFFENIEGFNGRQFTINVVFASKTWSLEEFGRRWYDCEISYWQPDGLVVLVEFEDGRRTVVCTRIPQRGEGRTVRLPVPEPTSTSQPASPGRPGSPHLSQSAFRSCPDRW